MTDSSPQQYTAYAADQRADESYERAGEYYVAASRGWLMRYRHLPEDVPQNEEQPGIAPKHLGRAVRDRLSGALCFRLAGQSDRARTVCRQGVFTVEDALRYDDFAGEPEGARPRIGLCHEMIGDLRLFGELGAYEAAYHEAETEYEPAQSPRGWQAEPEFDAMIRLLVDIADACDFEIDTRTRKRIQHASLTERIRYKRETYPAILETVLERGCWSE